MIEDLKINEGRKRLYYEKGYWGTDTLNDVWNTQSKAHANSPYIKDNTGTAFTYGQVDDAASKLASWLSDSGISNGDIVSFQIPKWAEFCIIYVACLKVGAVMQPIAVKSSIEDIEYAINKVGSSAYICPTQYHERDYEKQFFDHADEMPSVRASLLIDKNTRAHREQTATLSQVLATYPPFLKDSPSHSDDVACILSTSGSTGTPKMALCTHNTILFSERSYISVLGLTEHDVMWMPSPLNHATGFFHGLISAMLLGGSTVLQQNYSPEEAVKLINEQGCTWSHGATPFIYDILHYLDKSCSTLPSLRIYLCGGAPVPGSMVERAYEHGILLCESYGSTESCPHVYVPPEKCLEWDGRFSGIPYKGIEVRVVDQEHQNVAPGIQGEEASRGPHQFVGYLNDPERTARALDDQGWFYSGDLCTMDEQGRIKIDGRIKEIIIRGGENISANEVDGHLSGCPFIGDHATIGMPDERLGERICTFVVGRQGAQPTLSDVTGYLESKSIPKRLWPERIEYINEIPYTATGKVKRYLLAQELLKRLGRKGEA